MILVYMRRLIFVRRICPMIKEAFSSTIFWNRIIGISMVIIAIELFVVINKDKDTENAIPVYVVGGDIDVKGSVEVGNVVEVEGVVDVNNTVQVSGVVGTY